MYPTWIFDCLASVCKFSTKVWAVTRLCRHCEELCKQCHPSSVQALLKLHPIQSELQKPVFLLFTVKLSSTHLTLTLSSLIINLLQSYHQFVHSHVDKVSSSLLSTTQLDHTPREYESFSKSVAVSLLASNFLICQSKKISWKTFKTLQMPLKTKREKLYRNFVCLKKNLSPHTSPKLDLPFKLTKNRSASLHRTVCE